MDVSIIIVNYNTKDITLNCIESVFQHTNGVQFEVIVVDNASTDESLAALSLDKRIVLIRSKENLGFGRANNLGYKQAVGKYLFLLNSDTLLQNNAVKEFFDIAEQEPDMSIGCWGTMLKDAYGSIGISYGRFPSLWRDLYIQTILLPYSMITKKSVSHISDLYNYKTTNGVVDYISGADLFIKKEVADKYGLFSPEYFLYCEETDMQKRYNKAHIYSKIVSTPNILHLEGGSQKKSNNLNRNLIMLRSKMFYFRSWNSTVSFYLYLLLITPFKYLSLLFSNRDKDYRNKYMRIMWRKEEF